VRGQPAGTFEGEREIITNGQAVLVIIGAILAVTAIALPGPAIEEAGNDAYLSTALASVPAYVSAALFYYTGRRYRWEGPLGYLPRVFGQLAGKAVLLVHLVFFVLVAAAVGQEVPSVLGAVTMPLTPPWVFVAATVLTASYVAYLGVENFSRLAQIVLPFLLAVLLVVPVMVGRFAEVGYLLPILGDGWRPVLRGMAVPLAIRLEGAILFAFLLPHMMSPRRALRAGAVISSALALVLAVNAISVMTVFSPEIASTLQIPTLSLARMIRLGAVEHLETLVLGPWLMALMLKFAFYTYLASRILQAVSGVRDWKALVFPIAALTGALGLYLLPDSARLNASLSEVRPGLALLVAFVVPSVTLAVSLIRGRGHPARQEQAG